MMLHPLPPDARCPYCRKGGLAFVRQRGLRGDVYRCTAATPCEGRALHHRRNLGACGVSAEAVIGPLLFWTECPSQEPTAIRGDGSRIPHHPPGRRAAARQDAHGRPPLGQRQALRYEGEQLVASTGGRTEGVHFGIAAITSNMPSFKTLPSTWTRVAPSARRMPVSLVFRAATYDTIPYRPMHGFTCA